MPHVTLPDGVRLYYEHERPSAGEGPVVLLLMGLGANGRIWEPMVRRMTAAGYEVVTLDNRGCGRSSSPRLPWTTRTMAADAVEVMDALAIDRAHLIGASLGGMIAQELALGFPERVLTLILGCTTGGLPRMDLMPRRGLWQVVVAAARTAMPRPELEQRVTGFLRLAVSPEFARDCPPGGEAWAAVEAMLADPMSSSGFVNQALAASRHGTWRRPRRLEMPVQVQHGTADRLIPVAAGRELARAIPNAELEVIDGAGHALVLERPDEIFERAQRFLASHAAAA